VTECRADHEAVGRVASIFRVGILPHWHSRYDSVALESLHARNFNAVSLEGVEARTKGAGLFSKPGNSRALCHVCANTFFAGKDNECLGTWNVHLQPREGVQSVLDGEDSELLKVAP
jgi:hypothetical protein